MKAVLFDLDGTLLDIELGAFLRAYFNALGKTTSPHFPGVDVMPAVLASTDAMQRPHPGRTNQQAFHDDFRSRTGVDLDDPGTYDVFEGFYAEVFPGLRGSARPMPGGRLAVETALDLGLEVVIATQAIFPRAAIEHRLAWAGLADLGLERLTTYEVMHACKPQSAYFREAAAMAEVGPAECIMVGDDPSLDMPAADIGMSTYHTGAGATPCTWRGDMAGLVDLLPRLIDA